MHIHRRTSSPMQIFRWSVAAHTGPRVASHSLSHIDQPPLDPPPERDELPIPPFEPLDTPREEDAGVETELELRLPPPK